METDGLDPLRHSLTDHIVPSMRNAKVISCFYEGITSEQVKEALEGMISYNKLLLAPSKFKRAVVNGILKASGNYKEMHGLMVNYKPNPLCEDSSRRLMELYKKAEKLAVQLINEYSELDDWNPVYKYTFGSKLMDENINGILPEADHKRDCGLSDIYDRTKQQGNHIVKGGMPA